MIRSVLPNSFHRIFRWFAGFALITLVSLGFPHSASADGPSPDYRNISNLNEADLAVAQILQKCEGGKEVILYQVGDRIPENLSWMVKRLAQHQVRVTIHQLTETELQGELSRLESAPVEYQELMTFSPSRERLGFSALLERGKQWVSRLFGVQRKSDLSLWIPIPRSPDIVRMDRIRGVYAGLTASASLGLSFVSSYAKSGTPITAEILTPMLSLGTWVYFNVSLFRSMGQTMTQGKSIQKTAGGWAVKPNSPFFWSASFLRSMMTNSIIQFSMLGPSGVFGVDALQTNMTNSVWSLVSRSEVDKYIASKTPSVRDESGKLVVGPGQWSERQAANVNFWWNFSHGMVKNLHLLNFDPQLMTLVFGGLAAINLGLFVKEQLPDWMDRVSKFGNLMKEGVVECKTLLVVEGR